MNRSSDYKFETGTLVVWAGEVCLVDHNSWHDTVHVVFWPDKKPVRVNEYDLRTLTFRDFIWFRHPLTGHYMCGKTRGYMAAIINLFALILIGIGIATWGDGATWTAIVMGVAVLVLFWVGTWKNYTGKWR